MGVELIECRKDETTVSPMAEQISICPIITQNQGYPEY